MVLTGRRHREEAGSSKSGEVRCARALRCCCGLEEKAEKELLSSGLDRSREEDLVVAGGERERNFLDQGGSYWLVREGSQGNQVEWRRGGVDGQDP